MCGTRCLAIARVTSQDGSIELLGRESQTINSGGEKIFVEEVETALASHPAVADVVVSGRPSERWGQEVVAIVALAEGASVEAQELIDHASDSIARYKLPKAIVFRPVIERSPAGKADYRWAREQAISDDRLSRRRVRLRAMRSATPTPACIEPLNGGAARPVTLNGRSVPTTVR